MIGVHSPKFPGEKSPEALAHAVRRLAVGHPVVNDRDFRVWQHYAVRAWPTLMFIDPRGKVIGRHEGEFDYDEMDRALAVMIEEFDREGCLDRRPVSFTAKQENEPDRPLFFPGKVLADPAGGRLFVADTGHHRLLAVGLQDGRLRQVFGSGRPGLADGPADAAQFHGPQGMALRDDALLVADAENHALRRVDLATGRVETVAGTGEQARGFRPGTPARQTPLNSPWDVAVLDGRVFVALAGSHQVWEYDAGRDTISPWAGSGRENITDGPRPDATLAQPSGLAADGPRKRLYVADSEASGVRAIDLSSDGQVRTLVGRGLFEFGDTDGAAVRLQHPLGLTMHDGGILIADSYNHKLKLLDPQTKEVHTVAGSGRPGVRDGPAREAEFSEPGGLSAAAGRVYVADTNNHAIRYLDASAAEVRTLELTGLEPPKEGAPNTQA